LGEPERDVALAIPVAFALLIEKPLLALCMSRIGSRAVTILKGDGQQATGGNKVNKSDKNYSPTKKFSTEFYFPGQNVNYCNSPEFPVF
jgi:hypothetical protein